jgi:hypothetical protein
MCFDVPLKTRRAGASDANGNARPCGGRRRVALEPRNGERPTSGRFFPANSRIRHGRP